MGCLAADFVINRQRCNNTILWVLNMGSYFCMSMKILFVSVAIMMVIIFPYSAIPQSFAVSDLSVTTQRDKYHIDDTMNISGSLYRASEDEMTLKVYNNDAKVVWTGKIPIGINDDKFDYSLVLSGPAWKTSGIYVIIAEIDDTIESTSFKFSLEKRVKPLVTLPSTNQTAMIDIDSLAQQITQQLLSSSAFSQPQQQLPQLDMDSLARQITSQLLSSPDFSQPQQQLPQLDMDSLAQQITQQILSSYAFSQPQQSQQLDPDKLAQQITQQILSSYAFSQPQQLSKLDPDQLARQITQQILSSPAFSQPQLDTDQLAQQILSSSAFSQPQQLQSQLDMDSLAQQITSQLLAKQPISPPISNYTNEMSQENTHLANENLKLKADNRELINQNNILGESISKLQTTIDEQFQSIANITQELAEVRTVLKELFG